VAIDRDRVLAAAQKYVEKKRYDRAVIEYQRVIKEDPSDARTLLKIGDLQSKMEAYADAVASYDRVGMFYASQGFALKAIAVYKQIREIVAKHVPQLEEKYAHVVPKLAELYQQLGLTSDALAALDEVATKFHRQGRSAEALDVFRKIVELDPSNPLPHLRLAEALSRAKDPEAAVSEFAIAAGLLVKLGRRDDALKVLDRLLHQKADPTHARIAAELYLARNSANDGLQALSKLQICFQANPRDIDTLALLAKAFNQIGQSAKAIEVQKEMARIARDTGKTELFRELLDRLQTLAPNDEGVRQLTFVSSAPPPNSAVSDLQAVSLQTQHADDEGSYEDVADSDFEPDESAAPPMATAAATHRARLDPSEAGSAAERVPQAAPPLSGDEKHQIVRILGDAASFRRARLHAKTIETLRAGLAVLPRSRELHEMLRDVLLETGRVREAVPTMLDLASLDIDALDGDAAARTLQDVLMVDPTNKRAAALLHELGYELVEEPASVSDVEAPLPAFDLEDIGPAVVGSQGRPGGAAPHAADRPPVTRATLDAIDDPFGDGPLPSFPLEPESDAESNSPLQPAAGPAAFDSPHPPPGSRSSQAPAGTLELEAALEEAEFFSSRGLHDDARAILEEQLLRLPNHPLIVDRLVELDAQEGQVPGRSGARPSPAGAAAVAGEKSTQEDRAFDIAESLGKIDAAEVGGFRPGTLPSGEIEQVDVEDVFAKFKEGVAKQISVDDAQSHYDLGVAYKEMGLSDDAIREFETAARDAKKACVCHSMIGMIHVERGNLNAAIDAFTRGLQTGEPTKEQEAALSYEIGAAFEGKRVGKQALEYFQRAARLAPTYRDVQERIRRLQKTEMKQSMRAAVGADDELDRAFDDMLGKS
jgi:tetratricopeptide (TPR) repeat protein